MSGLSSAGGAVGGAVGGQGLRRTGWPVAVVAGAAVLGGLVAVSPLAALALAALAVVGLLARTPLGRLLLFTLGVLLVFQSDTGSSAPRLAYVVLIVALAPVAWLSFLRSDLGSSPSRTLMPSRLESTPPGAESARLDAPRLPSRRVLTRLDAGSVKTRRVDRISTARRAGSARRGWRLPLLPAATVATLVVVATSLLALTHMDAGWSDVIRDAATYVLIACGVPYGLDAGAHLSERVVDRLAVVVGVLGAFAFTVAWLSRRGQPLLGLDQFALASSVLVLPGIAVAFARYFRGGPRALSWLVMGLLQTALIVSSGGRGTVLYLGALIGTMLVLGPRISRGPGGLFRTLGVLLAGVAALAALIAVSTELLGSDFLAKRLNWFDNASFAAVQADGSGQERLRAYGILQDAVAQHPLIGYGFGHAYPSVKDMLVREGTFTLDSPLILPAKFGVIGAAALLLALALLLVGLARAARGLGPVRAEVVAIVGSFAVSLLASLPAGSPMEQKGFGAALALLVAACVSRIRPQILSPARPDGGS